MLNFDFKVEDKEEFDKLLELVKNNEVPPDAPTIPDPSTSNDGKIYCLINSSQDRSSFLSTLTYV